MKRNLDSEITFYGYKTDKDGQHEVIATMSKLTEKTAHRYFRRFKRELNSKKFLHFYPMFSLMKCDEIYAVVITKKEF